MSDPAPVSVPRRLVHFTPLRYPGGKGKLAAFVKQIIERNGLSDGLYVEPFAGGSAVALELLFQEYVSRICINDLSVPIYSFWKSVTERTEDLCRLITDTPVSVEEWKRQKLILGNLDGKSELEIGFAAFYLNRTNRSGILNGGIIGGLNQEGPWKIDARYNTPELTFRIQKIGEISSRISVSNKDALKLLKDDAPNWPKNTLVYLDPPYFVKGRQLYYDFYKADDHRALASAVAGLPESRNWIVSYDNVPEIRKIYSGERNITYTIGYSARSAGEGDEVMYFSKSLVVPPIAGPLKELSRAA